MSVLVHQIFPDRWAFTCPGCGCAHYFDVGPGRWTWNQSVEAPTVSPSIKTLIPGRVCHLFVKEGELQFLGDSHHELAGQTVPIPPWDSV